MRSRFKMVLGFGVAFVAVIAITAVVVPAISERRSPEVRPPFVTSEGETTKIRTLKPLKSSDGQQRVKATRHTLPASVTVNSTYVNLMVADVIAPASAELEDSIDVTVVVGNTGTAASGGFVVSVSLQNPDSTRATNGFYKDSTVPTVAAGDTVVVTFSDIEIDILSPSGPALIKTLLGVNDANDEDDREYTPITIGSAGDTVCVYFEDFSDGPGGWTPIALTGQAETYWHRDEHDLLESGLGGEWALVCSTADSVLSGGQYLPWEGYGSNWTQRVRKTYTLPAAPVSMEYDYRYDVEPAFDYLYARIRPVGSGTFTTLATYNGAGVGHETLDLSPWAGQTIEFEYFFQSDNAYDDSDGLYPSYVMPAGIDNIEVTGHPWEGFETDDEGWTTIPVPPTPGSYRLVETPQCFPGYADCDSTSGGAPYDACNVWVAYDSLTGEFPYLVPGSTEFDFKQHIGIASPTIPLPVDGNRYYLECDVYWDIPPGAHLYATFDWSPDGISWLNNGYIYMGEQGWERWSIDISGSVLNLINAGFPMTDFAYRWRVLEFDFFYEFTGPTPGPYFNNVAVKVAGTSAPGVPCESDCGTPTGVDNTTPSISTLEQNYPNPFNPTTTIAFSLAEAGTVELSVYDVAGRLVRTLANGHKSAARHNVSWDGRNASGQRVASGVYFCRLQAGQFSATRKMIILK